MRIPTRSVLPALIAAVCLNTGCPAMERNDLLDIAETESIVSIPHQAAMTSHQHLDRAFVENDFSKQETKLLELLYEFFRQPSGAARVDEFKERINKTACEIAGTSPGKLGKASAGLWINIGRELRLDKDLEGAKRAFEEALVINGTSVSARRELKAIKNWKPADHDLQIGPVGESPPNIGPAGGSSTNIGPAGASASSTELENAQLLNDEARTEQIINQAMTAADENNKSLLALCKLKGKDAELADTLFDLFSGKPDKKGIATHSQRLNSLAPNPSFLWKALGIYLQARGDSEGAEACDQQAGSLK